MATETTVQTDVTKAATAVKTDVNTDVNTAVNAVKAEESKLSRTQLAWAAGVIGLVVGFLIKLFV